VFIKQQDQKKGVMNLTSSGLKDDKDDRWTKWIQAIRKATVYFVKDNNENWLNDGTCIQIKRMTVDDLKSQDTVSEVEHRYEQTLDVVKLPMPIPDYLAKDASSGRLSFVLLHAAAKYGHPVTLYSIG
jgi:hypothetical protein